MNSGIAHHAKQLIAALRALERNGTEHLRGIVKALGAGRDTVAGRNQPQNLNSMNEGLPKVTCS